ncbi:MAG: hypothetical protein ACYC3I_05305 [Gemmataceae bacterium]
MGRINRRRFLVQGAAALTLALAGCSTGPLRENPTLLRPEPPVPQENPLYLFQGPQPEVYDKIFQCALDVVDDFFEIAYTDRFGGRIESQPAVAPGWEQPWKPGSPDFYQRLLANFQSIRHRCIVLITTAEEGGYYIDVKVLKELEDLPTPVRATAGSASFNMVSTIERQFEVIDQNIYESGWIPIGRDLKLEQVILERLARCDFSSLPKPETIYGPAPAPAAR